MTETTQRFNGKTIALAAPFAGDHHYSHFITRAMRKLGIKVIKIDYRSCHDAIEPMMLGTQYDALIVNPGEGIPASVIEKVKKPKLLWFGEYIFGDDEYAEHRLDFLKQNCAAFDYVIWEGEEEPKALQIMRDIGCKNVDYVYPARIDPDIFKYIKVESKQFDVAFIGTVTDRRKKMIEQAAQLSGYNIQVITTYNMDEQVEIINNTKINLHINFCDFHTYSQVNLRVMDILQCKGFCITEGVDNPKMFDHEKHLVYFKPNDPADLANKIKKYMLDVIERNRIADNGYRYVRANYSTEKSVIELLSKIKEL